MSQAAESKLGALFINSKYAVPVHKPCSRRYIHSLKQPHRWTILPHVGWSIRTSRQKQPNQWTLVFVGCVIESAINNSEYIRDLAQQIWEIIGQSITQVIIIKTSASKSSHPQNIWIHSNECQRHGGSEFTRLNPDPKISGIRVDFTRSKFNEIDTNPKNIHHITVQQTYMSHK